MSAIIPASPLLPAFQATQHNFVTGTITAHEKIHYTSSITKPWTAPESFDVVTVELDQPVNGELSTKAIINVKEGRNPLGHRLRGKLFTSVDQMTEIRDMASEWNDAYKRQYEYMKADGSVFFDFRTLHIAADDPKLQASGDAVRACLDMGLSVSSGEDYYVAEGIQCGSLLQGPGEVLRPSGHFLNQEPKHP